MPWAAVVGVVGGAVVGANAAAPGVAAAAANTRISAARAKNDNKVRDAQNNLTAAQGSLARYLQSVKNNQTLAAGGAALEAHFMNFRRESDASMSGSFEDQIRNAEQLGAQAASNAFSGVGGEVADMISASTRLMQQRASEAAARNRDFSNFDAARRAGAIAAQTVRGLDNSLLIDSLDYRTGVGQSETGPSRGAAALSGAWQGLTATAGIWGNKQSSGGSLGANYDAATIGFADAAASNSAGFSGGFGSGSGAYDFSGSGISIESSIPVTN